MSQLAALFAQYGVEPFLESTGLFVVLLDHEGGLLSWNPSFDSFTQTRREKTLLRDFLSPASAERFTELLSISTQQRIRTKGELAFDGEARTEHFVCLLIPLPGKRVLLIAEPAATHSELEAVTAELQKTKRILTVKETELKAVLAQADEVSHTDALTFLPNRRQIIGDLQKEVIFSDRYGTPLSISMLDIDHFKKINDTYGHTVGDEVLRTLAGELRDHIRYPDTIGRYGGEEFLIVLPHSTFHAAAEQAERLCGLVRSLLVKSGEHQIAVTVSIGVAQYKIHKEDWEAFLRRADAALYQAKNNGRDRWAVSEE
ncbi:MAG TPA: sensor domain-containing diguanylate cyclase [Anaerolineales bacterium]|nr:sensor domain-containing diguanylate cyclase [Anaerolineales bacterium]